MSDGILYKKSQNFFFNIRIVKVLFACHCERDSYKMVQFDFAYF